MRQLVFSAFDDLWLVSRYVAVGTFAVALNIGLLFIFKDILDLWYLVAAGIAFIITFISAFLLQKHFTFRDGAGAYRRQGISYLMIGLLNLSLDTALLYIAVDVFGLWYLGAQFMIMAVLAFASFLANRHITFARDAEYHV